MSTVDGDSDESDFELDSHFESESDSGPPPKVIIFFILFLFYIL